MRDRPSGRERVRARAAPVRLKKVFLVNGLQLKNSMVSPPNTESDCAASALRNWQISSSLRRMNVFHVPIGPAGVR